MRERRKNVRGEGGERRSEVRNEGEEVNWRNEGRREERKTLRGEGKGR